jgi:hypothetical protein
VTFHFRRTGQRRAEPKFASVRFCLRLFGVFLTPSALYAQSCSMCYSTAANSGAQLIQALKEGILILLFPSLLIGTLFVVIAYRKRNQYAKY